MMGTPLRNSTPQARPHTSLFGTAFAVVKNLFTPERPPNQDGAADQPSPLSLTLLGEEFANLKINDSTGDFSGSKINDSTGDSSGSFQTTASREDDSFKSSASSWDIVAEDDEEGGGEADQSVLSSRNGNEQTIVMDDTLIASPGHHIGMLNSTPRQNANAAISADEGLSQSSMMSNTHIKHHFLEISESTVFSSLFSSENSDRAADQGSGVPGMNEGVLEDITASLRNVENPINEHLEHDGVIVIEQNSFSSDNVALNGSVKNSTMPLNFANQDVGLNSSTGERNQQHVATSHGDSHNSSFKDAPAVDIVLEKSIEFVTSSDNTSLNTVKSNPEVKNMLLEISNSTIHADSTDDLISVPTVSDTLGGISRNSNPPISLLDTSVLLDCIDISKSEFPQCTDSSPLKADSSNEANLHATIALDSESWNGRSHGSFQKGDELSSFCSNISEKDTVLKVDTTSEIIDLIAMMDVTITDDSNSRHLDNSNGGNRIIVERSNPDEAGSIEAGIENASKIFPDIPAQVQTSSEYIISNETEVAPDGNGANGVLDASADLNCKKENISLNSGERLLLSLSNGDRYDETAVNSTSIQDKTVTVDCGEDGASSCDNPVDSPDTTVERIEEEALIGGDSVMNTTVTLDHIGVTESPMCGTIADRPEPGGGLEESKASSQYADSETSQNLQQVFNNTFSFGNAESVENSESFNCGPLSGKVNSSQISSTSILDETIVLENVKMENLDETRTLNEVTAETLEITNSEPSSSIINSSQVTSTISGGTVALENVMTEKLNETRTIGDEVAAEHSEFSHGESQPINTLSGNSNEIVTVEHVMPENLNETVVIDNESMNQTTTIVDEVTSEQSEFSPKESALTKTLPDMSTSILNETVTVEHVKPENLNETLTIVDEATAEQSESAQTNSLPVTSTSILNETVTVEHVMPEKSNKSVVIDSEKTESLNETRIIDGVGTGELLDFSNNEPQLKVTSTSVLNDTVVMEAVNLNETVVIENVTAENLNETKVIENVNLDAIRLMDGAGTEQLETMDVKTENLNKTITINDLAKELELSCKIDQDVNKCAVEDRLPPETNGHFSSTLQNDLSCIITTNTTEEQAGNDSILNQPDDVRRVLQTNPSASSLASEEKLQDLILDKTITIDEGGNENLLACEANSYQTSSPLKRDACNFASEDHDTINLEVNNTVTIDDADPYDSINVLKSEVNQDSLRIQLQSIKKEITTDLLMNETITIDDCSSQFENNAANLDQFELNTEEFRTSTQNAAATSSQMNDQMTRTVVIRGTDDSILNETLPLDSVEIEPSSELKICQGTPSKLESMILSIGNSDSSRDPNQTFDCANNGLLAADQDSPRFPSCSEQLTEMTRTITLDDSNLADRSTDTGGDSPLTEDSGCVVEENEYKIDNLPEDDEINVKCRMNEEEIGVMTAKTDEESTTQVNVAQESLSMRDTPKKVGFAAILKHEKAEMNQIENMENTLPSPKIAMNNVNKNMLSSNEARNVFGVLKELTDNVLDAPTNMGGVVSYLRGSSEEYDPSIVSPKKSESSMFIPSAVSSQEQFNTKFRPEDFDILIKDEEPCMEAITRESLYIKFDPIYQQPSDKTIFVQALKNMKWDQNQISPPPSISSKENVYIDEREQTLRKEIQRLQRIYDERQLLAIEDENNYKIRCDEIDLKCKEAQKTIQRVEENEKSMQRQLQDMELTNRRLTIISKEFQVAMESLMEAMKQQRVEHSKKLAKIQTEKEGYQHHLESAESAFIDVLRKYDKISSTAEELRNEQAQKERQVAELNLELVRQDERLRSRQLAVSEEVARYEKYAADQTASNATEIARLNAQLRKAALSLENIQSSLDKKTTENQKLAAICDDLIAGN